MDETQLFAAFRAMKRVFAAPWRILKTIAALFGCANAAPWPLHKRSFFAAPREC